MSNKDKGKSIFGLEKIPAEVLLKYARIEMGKLRAYIDELEYDICKLKEEIANLKSLSPQERKELGKETLYEQQDKELRELRDKVNTLRKDLEREMRMRLQFIQGKES